MNTNEVGIIIILCTSTLKHIHVYFDSIGLKNVETFQGTVIAGKTVAVI
jgi:hypothetical protein